MVRRGPSRASIQHQRSDVLDVPCVLEERAHQPVRCRQARLVLVNPMPAATSGWSSITSRSLRVPGGAVALPVSRPLGPAVARCTALRARTRNSSSAASTA